jgi:hypothetical protein
MASEDQKWTSSPERAVAATERSHAICIRASAPVARTASTLAKASTRTPWRAADDDHQREHDDRDPGEGTGDRKEHADEDEREEQVGDGNNGSGREKLLHRIEVPHLIGKNADRSRTLGHLQRDDVLEDVRSQDDIDFLACHINDAAAHRPNDQVEDDGNPHANAERDE